VLQISEECLEAVCKGVPVEALQLLKSCPNCWTPGTEAESMWLHPRSKYCFACGTPEARSLSWLQRADRVTKAQILPTVRSVL